MRLVVKMCLALTSFVFNVSSNVINGEIFPELYLMQVEKKV